MPRPWMLNKSEIRPYQERAATILLPNSVKQINAFHYEVITEVGNIAGRINQWLDAEPPLDDGGRATLLNAIDLAITDLRELFKQVEAVAVAGA